jgi:hypothetical protein
MKVISQPEHKKPFVKLSHWHYLYKPFVKPNGKLNLKVKESRATDRVVKTLCFVRR